MCSDDKDKVDQGRRKFLTAATATVGAVGVAAIGVPFVSSMNPSKKALAAGGPVKIKVDTMKPVDQLTVMWRGKPVWIICRDKKMVSDLPKLDSELRDPKSKIDQQPKYAQNEFRSRNPDYLVVIGVCTHLGCAPTFRPDPKSVEKDWPGGFFCSCHGSKFDLAGRVFKGVPAPINLEVPQYAFNPSNPKELIIGLNTWPKEETA